MNPWLILAGLLALAGAFGSGVSVGNKWAEGRQAIENNHIAEAVDAANTASAQAIAGIKVTNKTIQNQLEKQIETHTVYTDCRLDPVGLQLANQALEGRTKRSGDSKLPEADPAGK